MQDLASDRNQQFLTEIALLSQRNLLGRPVPRDSQLGPGAAPGLSQAGCSIKSLPERLLVQAAGIAVLVNPANAPGTFSIIPVFLPGFAQSRRAPGTAPGLFVPKMTRSW